MINSKVFLSPTSIVRILVIAVGILILLSSLAVAADSLTGNSSLILHKLVKLFYVEHELNVPSFFSSLILLMASVILAVIAFLKREQKDVYTIEWIGLTVGFLFMAFDELVSVHERMIEPTRDLLGGEHFGIFYFAWVIPMGIFVSALGVLFCKFWWNLPMPTKIYFALAAVIYLGGSIGCELIESQHCEIYGKDNLAYFVMTTVEETLEMTGGVFFIWALFNYLTETFGAVQLHLNNS
jgi:hypothetical protein